jgi:hypothetical protein
VLLAGCTGARPSAPPAPSSASPPFVARQGATSEFEAEPLELDTPVACRWQGRIRVASWEAGVRLCLEPERFCYAVARQDLRGWVSVGEERDPVALLELENFGMSLRGAMRLRSIDLHLQNATTFSGYFVPFRARVAPGGHWRDLEAELDLGTGLLHPKKMILSCGEVGLGAPMSRSDPEDRYGTQVAFTAARVPFSAERGGPVLFEISSDAVAYDDLQSIQEQGRFVQITLSVGAGFVQGWVPKAMIGPYRPPNYDGPGIGHGASGGCTNVWTNVDEPLPGVACPKTIPVFARVESRIARIGQIFNGTPVRLGTPRAGVVSVELPRPRFENCKNDKKESPDVTLIQGAELFVRARDVVDCH